MMRLYAISVQAILALLYLAGLYYVNAKKNQHFGKGHLIVNVPSKPGLSFAINITLLLMPATFALQKAYTVGNGISMTTGETICFAGSISIILAGLSLISILLYLHNRSK